MLALLLVSQLNVAAPAIAISVSGSVAVDTGDGTTRALVRFEQVPEGSRISTGADGLAQLRLASGSLVRLGPGTAVSLRQLEQGQPRSNRQEGVKLLAGRVWLSVTKLFGQGSKFEVETPNAVAGVRGTSFVVESTDGKDRFMLAEGEIHLRKGEVEATLDAPGSFIDATVDGLSAAGQLDDASVGAMLGKIGGAASTIAGKLAPPGLGARLDAGNERRRARNDILSPTSVVDSPLAIDAGPAPAIDEEIDVTVRVRLK
jgi:hypothetical protein